METILYVSLFFLSGFSAHNKANPKFISSQSKKDENDPGYVFQVQSLQIPLFMFVDASGNTHLNKSNYYDTDPNSSSAVADYLVCFLILKFMSLLLFSSISGLEPHWKELIVDS
jgi:hypothetical protein